MCLKYLKSITLKAKAILKLKPNCFLLKYNAAYYCFHSKLIYIYL